MTKSERRSFSRRLNKLRLSAASAPRGAKVKAFAALKRFMTDELRREVGKPA